MSTAIPAECPKSDPTLPVPRTIEYPWMSVATWRERFDSHVECAVRGGVDLLLVGDSITEGWAGTQVWSRVFGAYCSANFGIGGDATQNLLWRLDNGCIGALRPRVVVVLIGVNNLGREQHTPEETVRGIRAVVGRLRMGFPAAKIVLFAIFPADAAPGTPFRRAISDTNRLIAPLHDGQSVFFHDIGACFLERDGTLTSEVSPDSLHLSEEGYRRWADKLAPLVAELMNEKPAPTR